MKFESLYDLFVEQLGDMHDAETQITKTLPKLVKEASTKELKQAFEKHLQETKNHLTRLEEVFNEMGMKPSSKKCKALRGILDEGEELLEASKDPSVKDTALICAAQKVEHYEIATYGCLIAYAKQLGEDFAIERLHKSLEEEKSADKHLTELAESHINADAGLAQSKAESE
jgi:ferritin-like metal-binding protein YciE